jgi:uracil-DNA glycosylase
VNGELLGLVRELRQRVALSDESDFSTVSSAPANKSFSQVTETATPAKRTFSPASTPPRVAIDKRAVFQQLADEVSSCQKCPLGKHRLKAVFGVGSVDAQVMFIGEGPGYEEDHRGEPFVGKSGQLLDKILASIGLSRETVYIANIVKCHPMKENDPELRANDRPPTPEEIAACRPYLDRQIDVIGPKVIVTLGATPAKVLVAPGVSITAIRGQWREYSTQAGRVVKLLPTYHPAALLRNPDLKRDVWTDMKNLRKELGS